MSEPTASVPVFNRLNHLKRKTVLDRMSGALFSLVHRTNLVYNICWEDPRLDRVALDIGPDDNVLVITSAGCNALDYALQSPNHVYAVDMNPRQNALLELKVAGIKALDFEDFFQIFGKGRMGSFNRVYESALRPKLSPWSRKYWDKNSKFFESRKKSFYYHGSSGSLARLVNIYIDRFAKVRESIDALLDAPTVEDQRAIYDEIRDIFWGKSIRRFIGNDVALSMLGVPKPQRQQVEYHYGSGIAEFIEHCLEAVFATLPIQDNYFWRVYIKGEFSEKCCPEYLKEEIFFSLKENLADRISMHTDSVEGFLRKNEVSISKYVLLDHMDWLSTYRHAALENEWQAIVDRAASDCRVIYRSGGMKVDFVDPIRVQVKGRERQVGDLMTYYYDLANQLHESCRVHTYGSFYIADLNPA